MKLHKNNSDIERIGITQESTFTIKTTAKAFDILSSGLYSDKILAVVRELSCNAYDAHVSAGKSTIPFEIHLPNSLEPYFSVKDNGIGLSDEQIQGQPKVVRGYDEDLETMVNILDAEGNEQYERVGGLYTTYFESTKTDSNDFIGALGLGSKSPFSYSNAFEVISRYDGTISIYSIFLNETGIPSVALMAQKETDESNGLEVKLTVGEGDFSVFTEKVQKALKYFKTKPSITGNSYFKWDTQDNKLILSGKHWEILSANWQTRGKPIAIQGNVPYEIKIDLLDHLSANERYFLKQSRIVMYFQIGELEVAASREGLQYDKDTKTNIHKRVTVALRELQKEFRKVVKQHKECHWDLTLALNIFSDKIFNDRDTLYKVIDVNTVRSPALRKYTENNGKVKTIELFNHEIVQYSHSYNTRPKRSTISRYITPSSSTTVMINDVKVGGLQRIGKWLGMHSSDRVICIKQINNKNPKVIDHKKELDALIVSLGNPKTVLVSDLPPASRGSSSSKEIQLYESTENYRYPYKARWERTAVDLSKGGFYFRLKNRSNIVDTDGKCHSNQMPNHDRRAKRFLSIIQTHQKTLNIDFGSMNRNAIYGANLKAQKMIGELGNWYDVYALLDIIETKYIKHNRFSSQWDNTVSEFTFANIMKNERFVVALGTLDKGHRANIIFSPLIKKIEEEEKHRHTIDILRSARRLGETISDVLIDGSEFDERYPMLKYIDSHANLSDNSITDIIKYMETIDNQITGDNDEE